VAGVQHEPGTELPHGVPQPGHRAQLAGHGVVATGGVLDQHRDAEPAVAGLPGERRAPVVDTGGRVVRGQHVATVHDHAGRPDRRRGPRVLAEQRTAGDADPVVRQGDVDDVRRVHEDGDVGAEQRLGVRTRLRRLPALRIGEEHLDGVGVHLRGAGQRAAAVQLVRLGPARSDVHADQLLSHPATLVRAPVHRRAAATSRPQPGTVRTARW